MARTPWPRTRRSKFGVRTDAAGRAARTADGRLFASRRECERYLVLRALERAGKIRGLVCQPAFRLVVGGRRVATYNADFKYFDCAAGRTVVEDVKGVRTSVYRLKKKLVEALYDITVREV